MPPSDLTDGEIIERIRDGDILPFSTLVERYQGPLLALAMNRLGRRDLAEDAVQEAFLCAYKWLASYDSKFAFRTWLWTILLNQCSRTAERERRALRLRGSLTGSSFVADESESANPSSHLETQETQSALRTALRQLPQSHADAIRLRFFGELKFDAIAQATGCSLRTAKYRVKEGLQRLGDLLQASSMKEHAPAEEAQGAPHSIEVQHALR